MAFQRRDWTANQLYGAEGAHRIVNEISKGPPIVRLPIAHNALGDAGCEVLFGYLCSDGQHHPIVEIGLNSAQVSNAGLRAVARYLDGNATLRELFLQNNQFTSDPTTIASFITALNSSSLRRLSLSSNSQLSDAFARQFFPALAAPRLEVLLLSATGLSAASAEPIADFLASPRARSLREITLNGNDLGRQAVMSIARAVDRENRALTRCEMYSILVGGEGEGEERAELSRAREALKRALVRNLLWAQETQRDALRLLRHARVVLVPLGRGTTNDPRLPVELVLYVLAFLAPHLSAGQRARVCNYAADTRTLPSLLPTLTRRRTGFESERGIPPHASIHGAQSVWGMEARTMWLASVECDAFELSG